MAIIKVSDETKAKVKQTWGKVKAVAAPLFCGATIGAAWFGYVNSIRNTYGVEKNKRAINYTAAIVDNNAKCSQYDRERIDELERQNAILMRKALEVTAGTDDNQQNNGEAA